MALLTVADARMHINTGLADADLGAIIAREEAELIRKCGAHGDGTTPITETVDGGNGDLFLSKPFVSISSITERAVPFADVVTVDTTTYLGYPRQGRILRNGVRWGSVVNVTYIPVDETARRVQVLIELVRLAIEQTAMKSESVAGEYSYSAPEWEAQRAAIYRRAMFTSL